MQRYVWYTYAPHHFGGWFGGTNMNEPTETTTESGETIGGYEPLDLQVVVGLLFLLQTISNPSNCPLDVFGCVWFEANLKTFVNWGLSQVGLNLVRILKASPITILFCRLRISGFVGPKSPRFCRWLKPVVEQPTGCVWKCCVPLNPIVLLIRQSLLNGYCIGNIPYFQTNPTRSTNLNHRTLQPLQYHIPYRPFARDMA